MDEYTNMSLLQKNNYSSLFWNAIEEVLRKIKIDLGAIEDEKVTKINLEHYQYGVIILNTSTLLQKELIDFIMYFETISVSTVEIERFFKLIKQSGMKQMTNLDLIKRERRVKVKYNAEVLDNKDDNRIKIEEGKLYANIDTEITIITEMEEWTI
jgi:hypothetical protein